MSSIRTLDDLPADLDSRRIFVRVDFNVPLDDRVVLDRTRIEAVLPTLTELSDAGAKLVLASHCGRPKGRVDPRYSLEPVARSLADLIRRPVSFAEDCVGRAAQARVGELEPGGLCLLENLRYHPGETENSSAFVDQLAELADLYVDDAFGTAHRAHASVVGVPTRVAESAAGRLLMAELEALGSLLLEPARPFVALVGGAKISGKVETLINLLPRLDVLLLGGGMANTFLVARGADLADSLVEHESLETARAILEKASAHGVEVGLPRDLVVTDDLENPQRIETVAATRVPVGTLAVDIGEGTRESFVRQIGEARTLFWNGPMGVFEKPPFNRGTLAMARAAAESRGFSVIGGGETVAAARRSGVIDRIGHVSTGGGAALEFLAGRHLPGVQVLEKRS